jgi:hypothetical protein
MITVNLNLIDLSIEEVAVVSSIWAIRDRCVHVVSMIGVFPANCSSSSYFPSIGGAVVESFNSISPAASKGSIEGPVFRAFIGVCFCKAFIICDSKRSDIYGTVFSVHTSRRVPSVS